LPQVPSVAPGRRGMLAPGRPCNLVAAIVVGGTSIRMIGAVFPFPLSEVSTFLN
jgi:hypothetical protein